MAKTQPLRHEGRELTGTGLTAPTAQATSGRGRDEDIRVLVENTAVQYPRIRGWGTVWLDPFLGHLPGEQSEG